MPFGRTYIHNFLYYVYLHWSLNPKCFLIPVKPSGPPVLRRRLELNTSPVYYAMAPHAVVLLQTLLAAHIIDFLQEDEGEADL